MVNIRVSHRRKQHEPALLPTHDTGAGAHEPSAWASARSRLALVVGVAMCLAAVFLVVMRSSSSIALPARYETGSVRVRRLDHGSSESESNGAEEAVTTRGQLATREELATREQLAADFVPSTSCGDESTRCVAWQRAGECNRNPRYMHANCAASCGLCYTYAYGFDSTRYDS